jgi:chromatin assembly factor 1 subunit A
MGLDPWASSYWEPEAKPLPADTSASKMPPPAGPSNAFAAMRSSNPALKLVKPEIVNDVKQVIVDNKNLSKVGIIEVLYQRFRTGASRTEVKNTFEAVAEKSGSGRSKEWVLKAGC